VCVFLCTVFRLVVVSVCVMCVVCVLCLIVVPLPPGENPFAVKINIYLKHVSISLYRLHPPDLKMEIAQSPKRRLNMYLTTCRHILEDSLCSSHSHENSNLTSSVCNIFLPNKRLCSLV
jgi:hypothetical protein